MKIKTITCHQVYNHGASLQEYALLTYLESLEHNVHTLNYTPKYLSNHFKLNVVSNPKFNKPLLKQLYLLLKLPNRIKDLKRKKAFDQFSDAFIKTDKVNYTTNDKLKANLPEADCFICGSDQIWNSFFQNGKDPAFYLDFVPNEILKISYAASFATEEIADNLKPFVKEKVSRINHISVRETSALNILNDIGITNSVQVMDPVFLIPKEHWIAKFVKPINQKYIFVYDSDYNEQIERIAKSTAQKYGYKIITVDKKIHYADINYFFEAPDMFLSLIYGAELLITNSFHALSFSLIFNKKFIVVNRKEKINTRMRDLMVLTGTDHLLLKENSSFQFEDINLDFEKINSIVEYHTERSKEFLINALSSHDSK